MAENKEAVEFLTSGPGTSCIGYRAYGITQNPASRCYWNPFISGVANSSCLYWLVDDGTWVGGHLDGLYSYIGGAFHLIANVTAGPYGYWGYCYYQGYLPRTGAALHCVYPA